MNHTHRAAARRAGTSVLVRRWHGLNDPAQARRRMALLLLFMVCALAMTCVHADDSDLAIALRAGTPGIGAELNVGLAQELNARVGFSAFNYNRSVTSSDANYDGTLKLSMLSGLLDWYAFNGGFHITAGVVGNNTKIDVTGTPSAGGVYTINNTQYTSAQVGSITGQVKFGNTAEPYVGFGWGNPLSEGRWHFLFDVGAIYGGTPKVSLNAQCGVAAPPGSPLCTQLQSNVVAEQQLLVNDASLVKWYPIVNFGVAVKL